MCTNRSVVSVWNSLPKKGFPRVHKTETIRVLIGNEGDNDMLGRNRKKLCVKTKQNKTKESRVAHNVDRPCPVKVVLACDLLFLKLCFALFQI
jgi:hypothetical protein